MAFVVVAFVAEQGAAEQSVEEEIGYLLRVRGIARELLKFVHGASIEAGLHDIGEAGVVEVGEAPSLHFGEEIEEVVGVANLVEFIGKDGGGAALVELLSEHADGLGVEAALIGDVRGEEAHEGASLADAFGGVFDAARVEHSERAHGVDGLPARKGVVADVGDTVGCEQFAADPQDGGAGIRRDPGVHAVGDDVIERALAGAELADIGLFEADVGDAGGGRHRVAGLDVADGVIDADELGGGQGFGHGEEVRAIATADFEHTRALHAGGMQAQERGSREEAGGVCPGMGEARVGERFVGGRRKAAGRVHRSRLSADAAL